MRTIYPLSDQVLVRRIEAEETTAGGIIIPDTAKEKPAEGVIVAVGPGRYTETGMIIQPRISPNQRILFGKWTGTEIRVDGEDLVLMRESDILATVM